MSFAVDELVGACQEAIAEEQPALAVRDVLRRALERPGDVAAAFNATQGGLNFLHVAPDLTVLHVTWTPGIRLYPHDHNMWAVIGIYGGQEDNAFFRRDGDTIAESGGKSIRESDVLLLGDDVIHSVANPLRKLTGAIHVYGGDFTTKPRSQWLPDAYREQPHDMAVLREEFARANAAWKDVTVQ